MKFNDLHISKNLFGPFLCETDRLESFEATFPSANPPRSLHLSQIYTPPLPL